MNSSINLKNHRRNKRLLKKYLKEKVESLVVAEENLEQSNNIIKDLSHKYESINVDRDNLEYHYNKEFETIVNSLSSVKMYDQKTIESDSLLDVINRSIREIQEENRALNSVKKENERLLKVETEYEKLKAEHAGLKIKHKNLKQSLELKTMKKQMKTLIRNKLEAHRSELKFLKSTFQSEISIMKSSKSLKHSFP